VNAPPRPPASDAAPESPVFQASVRTLAEFVHRRGNLGGSGLFQPRDRALEGTRGHQRLQQSRGEDYQAEIPVEWSGERDGLRLRLTGRVDGILETGPAPLVEEIKTVDHRWNGEPDPVHFAQLRLYAALLSAQHDWDSVRLRLTYLDYLIDEETPFAETQTAAELAAFLEATLADWTGWLRVQADWLRVRNRSLAALPFPFSRFRAGQRALARRVYRRIRDGGNAFIEAPTGLGKTLATLYPAAKALALPQLASGQVFYVTAKTPGRRAARAALERLRAGGARLRSLTLTAREKICFGPSPCDPRACPFALGYYDRVRPAVADLLARETLGREEVEAVARAHTVCPFELALDASLWTDVVIGDFNHVFDPQARLQRHFGEGTPRHLVLIDEAHNLVDRSREMHSATLSAADLAPGPGAEAIRGRGESRARRALSEARAAFEAHLAAALEEPSLLPRRPYHDDAVAAAEAPTALLAVLRHAARSLEAFLAELPPGVSPGGWLEPYFALGAFLRTAESYDATCRTLAAPDRLTLLCLDPSSRLRETLRGLRAAIFFSATLSPQDYFRTLLGGGEGDETLALGSPFRPEQMRLRILPCDVTYARRPDSLAAVADAVAGAIARHPGNHLVFCPSLDYLDQLAAALAPRLPGLLCQSPGMDEAAREAFLARFEESGERPCVGLAVLGGVFSEGIDLPGRRLVGVTVIGAGIPRLSLERDLLHAYFDEAVGHGFDYAYRFPGMQRVLQAVGRLIRSEEDHGRALLIDHRFQEARYRRLFPEWWRVEAGPVE